MQDAEWRAEQERAQSVHRVIYDKLGGNIRENETDKRELVEFRRYMWEDTEHDALSSNQKLELHRQEEAYSLNAAGQNRLRELYNVPYFARIDFREDGETYTEQIYIGKFGLMDDETMEFLVYDWRSPVASMFYDAEYGPASYLCPVGEIKGKVSLRRQYVFEKGILQGMFDASVEVQDEILQHILSRSADDKMKTIVTTIQREQNRAIRDCQSEVLVIEGPAGSGKTSIALHRIAYLLYHNRKTLTSDQILLFSQSDVLSYYISDVLPSLGERSVPAATFGELAARVIAMPQESYFSYLESTLQNGMTPEGVSRFRQKGSVEFTGFLEKEAAQVSREGIGFSGIAHLGRPVITAEELKADFQSYTEKLTILERLVKVRNDFFVRLRSLRKERLPILEQELLEQKGETYYLDRRELRAEARLAWYKEFLMLEQDYNAKNMTDAMMLYLRFAGAFFGKDEAAAISRGDGTEKLRYEDVAPLLYTGCLLGAVKPLDDVRHVVVDEAQDYSYIQYRILSRLFRYARFTVLGDPAQTLCGALAQQSLSYIADAFRERKVGVLRLKTSYRPTREIGRFAASLLGAPAPELVDRHGAEPEQLIAANDAETAEIIRKFAASLPKGASAAIITKTLRQAKTLHGLVGVDTGAQLVGSEYDHYVGGLAMLPSWLAKGLEFDHVLVVNTDPMEPHLLYVCCTRALHRLAVMQRPGPEATALPERKKPA